MLLALIVLVMAWQTVLLVMAKGPALLRLALICAIAIAFVPTLLLYRADRRLSATLASLDEEAGQRADETARLSEGFDGLRAELRRVGGGAGPDKSAAPHLEALEAAVVRLLARQEELERGLGGLREDLAHELTQLGGRSRRAHGPAPSESEPTALRRQGDAPEISGPIDLRAFSTKGGARGRRRR